MSKPRPAAGDQPRDTEPQPHGGSREIPPMPLKQWRMGLAAAMLALAACGNDDNAPLPRPTASPAIETTASPAIPESLRRLDPALAESLARAGYTTPTNPPLNNAGAEESRIPPGSVVVHAPGVRQAQGRIIAAAQGNRVTHLIWIRQTAGQDVPGSPRLLLRCKLEDDSSKEPAAAKSPTARIPAAPSGEPVAGPVSPPDFDRFMAAALSVVLSKGIIREMTIIYGTHDGHVSSAIASCGFVAPEIPATPTPLAAEPAEVREA